MNFNDTFNPKTQNQVQTSIKIAQSASQQKHQETPTTKSIVRARPHARTMPSNTDIFSFVRFDNGDRSITKDTDTPDSNVGNIVDVFASTNINGSDPSVPSAATRDNPNLFSKSSSNGSTDTKEPDSSNTFNPFATSDTNINDLNSPFNSATGNVFITSNQPQSTNVGVTSQLPAQSSSNESILWASNFSHQNQSLTSNATSNFIIHELNDQNPATQKPTEGDRMDNNGASVAVNPQEIIANLAKSGFISETRSTLKTNGLNNSLLGNNNQPQQQLELAKTVHKFIPRHEDEILLDVEDPVEIHERYPDLWCRGRNTRTNKKGVFPVCCVDIGDSLCI